MEWRAGLSASVSMLALSMPAAVAQQAAGGGQTLVLEEIKVTAARKIEEKAVDVPLSTSKLSRSELNNLPIDAPSSLARSVPNLTYINIGDPTQSAYSIRGIGPLLRPLNTLDSTVSFNYDGVPTTLLGAGFIPVDLRDVEVLRGPQGTLYGRGSLAGAMNFTSNVPDGKDTAFTRLEAGSRGTFLNETVVGGTIVPDTMFYRAGVRVSNFNGDIPNGIIGSHDGGQKVQAARFSVRLLGQEGSTATLSAFYNNEQGNVPQFVLRGGPSYRYPTSGTDIHQTADREIAGGHLTVTRELEMGRLTAVTGFQHVNALNIVDITDSYFYASLFGRPPSAFANPFTDKGRISQRETVFSQEIRITSHPDSAAKWVAGLNYFRSDYDIHQFKTLTALPSPLANGNFDTQISSQTYGAFGEATVPLTEKLFLTGGLRLAHDNQDYDNRYTTNGFPGTVPFFSQVGRFRDTYLVGRTALDYKWTPEFMTYVSLARGHSSGGFEQFASGSPLGQAARPFQATTGWTYEGGFKAALLDGRLNLSAAGFYNDAKNGPTFSYDINTFGFRYVPYDYHTTGFEAEAAYALSDLLSLRGGIGFIESELVDVPLADATGVRSGNTVPNIPRWNGNAALDLKHPLAFGDFAGHDFAGHDFAGHVFGRVEYQYVGIRASDPANNLKLKPFSIVNLTAGIQNERFSLYGFARNLTDVRYEAFGSYLSPTTIGLIVGQGRTFGAGLTVRLQ
ncbi:MAG: TonB-dependent receptor [Methylobacterium sp.]|uniref:TonB-dependent receptor n=1 Tax=Methylobacterium sp. TaxID=409 RepID=UPI00272809A4|nr:TonB-dependent receptor [Methylobacterium sp.]MDO9427102.1 TonB-dependent receptor [Methylobacterium sp.]